MSSAFYGAYAGTPRSARKGSASWLRSGFAQKPKERIVKAKLRTQASAAKFSDRIGMGSGFSFIDADPLPAMRYSNGGRFIHYCVFLGMSHYRGSLPNGLAEESVWES